MRIVPAVPPSGTCSVNFGSSVASPALGPFLWLLGGGGSCEMEAAASRPVLSDDIPKFGKN